MLKLNYKTSFALLLFAFFILNLLQAFYTGVISDETYYRLYGEHLSWGYFDHPPMIALMTKVSSLFFSGSLGIRFMTTIIRLFTIFFTWKAIDEKHPDQAKVLIFFLLVSTTVLYSILGVITTPDSPLLMFTAMFLFAYRRFLKESTWRITALLSIAMAGLVYSKYQASLVIGMVVFSNLNLLTNRKFLLAATLALLLFTPHLYWQYVHGFPTFRYHLVDRATDFKWEYVLEYTPNLMATFNPFIFGAIVYILFTHKPIDLFERALYFLIIGIIIFFWASCTRGHIQPQWTVAASAPMIILLYDRIWESNKLKRFALMTIPPTFALIFIGRLLITRDPLDELASVEKHRPKTDLISKVAGDLPVLFLGSFQEPSKYSYFAHKKAFVLSSVDGRSTQFDIWQFEKQYHNKPVFICEYITGKSKWYKYKGGWISGFATDSLQTVNRMKITFDKPSGNLIPENTIRLKCTLYNPYDFDINFDHSRFPVQVKAVFLQGEKPFFQQVSYHIPIQSVKAHETITRELTFKIPDLLTGKYQFGICLSTYICNSLNSNLVEVNLE